MLNTRALSAQIIYAVLDEQKSLTACLAQLPKDLSASQKGQIQDFCYGCLRQFPKLNRLINQLCHTKLKPELNQLRYLLAVGIYQLLDEKAAEHAAIDETVEASKQMGLYAFTNMINAILREFQRVRETLALDNPQDVQATHPNWLVKQLKQAYPKGFKKIIAANLQQAPMWLRINQQQYADAQSYYALLQQAEINFVADKKNPHSIKLETPIAVDKLPNFFDGACTVQDAAAQNAARLLQPQDGERILDACAAPGGKTTHILELAPKAQVDALDIEVERLERVDQNLERLNQQAHVIAGDASEPQQWWDGILYDRILLDAPCSATGVIRRHPDILYLRREDDIQQLAQLQHKILKQMWQILKPGGTLVYATCSVLPQENKQQISQFLAQTSDAELQSIFASDTPADPGWQILPNQQNMDGFYYAVLKKQA
ncbi:16S rRNA (cytosine(967)-C(5))-methyltransferase RsmB [Catenovulum agarivorans]|uniref:16S rRNA (cytosine(967)-C(5))-methyltransferase RsmB n=1 Tax=Catenovulum agarivorans TaxID=1172192 RepID=UPI0002D30227|nr:16S rRNA (cytosine(967)-C(5))-methyltransferase RsmB [Catenovulum agarivorans]